MHISLALKMKVIQIQKYDDRDGKDVRRRRISSPAWVATKHLSPLSEVAEQRAKTLTDGMFYTLQVNYNYNVFKERRHLRINREGKGENTADPTGRSGGRG